MTTIGHQTRTYPFEPAERLDVDPRYAALRRTEPLTRIALPYGGEAWLVTRYDDIKALLADPRFSRAATVGTDLPRLAPERSEDTTLLSMDPPEHSRLRKLVAKAFTARRIDQLRPRIQQIVDERLDRMAEHGPPADLLESLALPLPVTVICELLGVPYEDRDRFRAWSELALSIRAADRPQALEASAALRAYLGELVAQRRSSPTDDLLGAHVVARYEGDRLTEEELIGLGVILLIAGHETIANQLGNFTYLLLTHPDQLDWLRRRPDRIPQAVEELLRFTPLAAAGADFPRVATEDVELGGVLIRAGEAVFFPLNSANRDEEVFDRPDELDLTRGQNPHVAFGHGVHHCLGAQLARLELQVAIGSLLRRFPGLRLAVAAEDVPWKRGRLVRGVHSLPVAW